MIGPSRVFHAGRDTGWGWCAVALEDTEVRGAPAPSRRRDRTSRLALAVSSVIGPGDDARRWAALRAQRGAGEPPARSAGRRRVLITVFLVATVTAVLVQNMPESAIKTGLMVPARPYLNLTGLDQSWSIFSPNPRQQTVYVVARVEHSDGSVAVHPIPTGLGPSAYWGYRWQKYEESLSDPTGGRALWRPYAEWVVNQDQQQGGRPVRVTLVRRASDNLPPGQQLDALPFVDREFYTAPVVAR
jgi:hypothetical protein